MATQFEKDGHIQAKIKGAMTYPIVVLCVVGAVVVLMMVAVIPIFSQMFEEMGTKLPKATQMLVNFSDFLKTKWYICIAIVAAIIFGVKAFKKTPTGQKFFGSAAIKMPIFGNLTVKSAAATFSRTFSTLLASGIPLIDAVEQTANVIKNKIIRDKLKECKGQVAKGIPLSKPIKDMEIFPLMLSQMMHIGEETGNIEDMMSKVADFYEEEVEIAADALSAMMEPLIIVVLAVVVGVIVIAIYSPILSMYDAVDNY
jgi:type IV pilus assembly protein PilC